ncbi:MAG: hypothetical protein JXB13_06580, partial [Phycisphaerae bacterium]|nr:hypothetical protein [Phycisphaerae bacterium]
MNKSNGAQRQIGVLLRELELHGQGSQRVSVEADVVEVGPNEELRHPIGNEFEDLEIRLAVWPEPWSQLYVEYRHIHSVNEARAQWMLRKLQAVRKEL